MDYFEQKRNDFADLEGRIELAVKFEDGIDDQKICFLPFALEKSQEYFIEYVEHIIFEIVIFEIEAFQ